jgi:hypothetical protein
LKGGAYLSGQEGLSGEQTADMLADIDLAVRYETYQNEVDMCAEWRLSKGEALDKLLGEGFLIKPEFFVFIDAYRGNLESLQEFCDRGEIPFLGILCKTLGE